MFKRKLKDTILQTAKKMPVLALLGPRQSGKTTLTRLLFPQHEYISLENYEEREFAQQDPRKLLEIISRTGGIILDEIQNAPQLLSYIQTYVDQAHRPG